MVTTLLLIIKIPIEKMNGILTSWTTLLSSNGLIDGLPWHFVQFNASLMPILMPSHDFSSSASMRFTYVFFSEKHHMTEQKQFFQMWLPYKGSDLSGQKTDWCFLWDPKPIKQPPTLIAWRHLDRDLHRARNRAKYNPLSVCMCVCPSGLASVPSMPLTSSAVAPSNRVKQGKGFEMTVSVTEHEQKWAVRQKQAKGTDKVFFQLMLTSNRVTLPVPDGWWWCLGVFCFHTHTQERKDEACRTITSLTLTVKRQTFLWRRLNILIAVPIYI